MTNEEILQKAIEKAKSNGLRLYFSHRQVYEKVLKKELPFWTAYSLIFWIPFAKAFWGTNIIEIEFDTNEPIDYFKFRGEAWQYHLQQMVLEEDPLTYLEKFL